MTCGILSLEVLVFSDLKRSMIMEQEYRSCENSFFLFISLGVLVSFRDPFRNHLFFLVEGRNCIRKISVF